MSPRDTAFDRRSVLKTMGSAAIVGAGLVGSSGSAGAIETKRRLTRTYSVESRLQAAFAQHGQGLVASLVENGIVSADFDLDSVEFAIDEEVTGLEPTAQDRLAGVTAIREDGTYTAFGMASTSSETHDIALYVQPEREEAYAIVEPKAGDERLIVTESGVTPAGCKGSECGYCCDPENRTLKKYQCDSTCTDCWVSSSSCSCADLAC